MNIPQGSPPEQAYQQGYDADVPNRMLWAVRNLRSGTEDYWIASVLP